jgi:hypothetical protein
MKELNEINIFKKFAKLYPIPLDIDSAKKNKEPAPDITCRTINNDTKTFELVQIIDTSLATIINAPLKLKDSFYNTLEKMEIVEKTKFKKKFFNALIMTSFSKDISQNKKISLIPKILNNLLILNKTDIGQYKSNYFPEIEKFIDWILITRGDFNGPIFDIKSITSFDDPITDEIRKKFNKTYKNKHEIELLAYYNFQPFNKFSKHIDEAKNYIINNYINSPFSRIWIYSIRENEIIFFYPLS